MWENQCAGLSLADCKANERCMLCGETCLAYDSASFDEATCEIQASLETHHACSQIKEKGECIKAPACAWVLKHNGAAGDLSYTCSEKRYLLKEHYRQARARGNSKLLSNSRARAEGTTSKDDFDFESMMEGM